MPKYDAVVKGNLVVVRVIILDEDDKVLLVRRSSKRNYNPGLWELPGGKLLYGMNLEDSAERIILKEVGMQIRLDRDFYHTQSRQVSEVGKYQGQLYVEITLVGTSLGGKVILENVKTPIF